jgi:hypothetical protein
VPRQSTTAPRSNGHDTIMLSLSAPIVYPHLRNHVKGFPARNPNYWYIYGSGQALVTAFILRPVCSWFDKLTMSGDAQAPQTARPEPVLSAAEGLVEG